MNRISRFDWLPERARPAWDTGFVPKVHRSCFGVLSHIINRLLTKLARSRFVFFFLRVYRHKHAKKELGQYLAILTSRLVNNPYLFKYKDCCCLSLVFNYCILYLTPFVPIVKQRFRPIDRRLECDCSLSSVLLYSVAYFSILQINFIQG